MCTFGPNTAEHGAALYGGSRAIQRRTTAANNPFSLLDDAYQVKGFR